MVKKLLLILLIALNGFGIFKFPLLLTPVIFACFVNSDFLKPNPYKNIFAIALTCLFLSFIPAQIYRGQSLLESFTTSATLSDIFYVIIFYAILKLKASTRDMQKVMVYLSLIASFIYIIQYLLLPYGVVLISGALSAMKALSVEGERFRIMGSGIYSLAYFYSLNQYINKGNKKYIGICFINIIPILLMGFRTMLAGIALFSFILLLKLLKERILHLFKYIIPALLAVIVLLQIPAVSSRIEYMIDKQQNSDDTFANEDYIRWVEFDYYVNEYPEGVLDRVFGSGRPNGSTEFGRHMVEMHEAGLKNNDWGLLGLSWYIGPFTVLALLWLNFRAIKLLPNSNFSYISIWFIYLIAISFTSMEYYRSGNYTIQALALCIAYRSYLEERIRLKSINN